jgi:hypothetical protein
VSATEPTAHVGYASIALPTRVQEIDLRLWAQYSDGWKKQALGVTGLGERAARKGCNAWFCIRDRYFKRKSPSLLKIQPWREICVPKETILEFLSMKHSQRQTTTYRSRFCIPHRVHCAARTEYTADHASFRQRLTCCRSP